MKTRIAWLLPLALGAIFVAGCSQKVTLKTDDGKSTGTVDVANKSANLNINGSTVSTGEKVSLPADWPIDVYVIPGTIKTAVSTPHISDTISLSTTSTMTAANNLYKQHLVADGWTIISSGVIDTHSAAIVASKGTRSLTVNISDSTTPTTVEITAALYLYKVTE